MDEELLAKVQPHSLEAEQAVLGSILIDSRCLSDVIGILRPEDFYLKQNQEIYATIYTMFNFSETIDPVTVLEKMIQTGVHHDNSRDYVLQLMQITPTAANAVRYANIVKDKALLRGLADAGANIVKTVQEQVGTPSDLLENAERMIYTLRKGETGDSLEHIGVTMHKVFDRLNELSKSDSAIPGLSTGLRDLDRTINGLNKSDLTLIAARPGMGKTAFALNLALNAAKKSKQTVAIFSLEMSREQLASRLMSIESFVHSSSVILPVVIFLPSTKLSMASRRIASCSLDISKENIATVLSYFFATFRHRFSAKAVLPIAGRAATSKRSERFRPLIWVSRSQRPVERPGIAESERLSSLSLSKTL